MRCISAVFANHLYQNMSRVARRRLLYFILPSLGSSVRCKSESAFKYLTVSSVGEKNNIGLIRLNDRKRMNALNFGMTAELKRSLKHFEQDKGVSCMVLTGSERAFSVGADITELQDLEFQDVVSMDFPSQLLAISSCRKPVIAAVNGYALGGGCELAMMCDIVYASESAIFSLPEIFLGTFPGAGGTQRLLRAVGKSKALEMILSGSKMSAAEAYRAGLVSKLFPSNCVLDEAVKLAEGIASLSPHLTQVAKSSVNAAFESSLSNGLQFEKALFRHTLALRNQDPISG